MIFRTTLAQHHAPGAAPIRIGIAVAQSIALLIDQRVGVKWPNDVVIPGHGKVAGILCEGVFRQGSGYIVAGVGINAFYPGDEYAAVADATDEPPLRGPLLQAIVRRLVELAPRITDALTDAEQQALSELDVLFGQQVKLESGLTGRAAGIAADGSLQVDTEQGMQAVRTATVRLADNGAYPGAGT